MEKRVAELEKEVKTQKEEIKKLKRKLFLIFKTDEHLCSYADDFR